MKLNGTPRHYMPLSQSQSDDEDSGAKKLKYEKTCCKNSNFSENFDRRLSPPTISNQSPKCLSMSPLRTLAFIFSLIMCVIFIGIFLLLLPCRPTAFGAGNIGDLLEKWTVILPNISFTSDVALAVTSHFSSRLLIFGYAHWESEASNTYGVMAVRKSDGEQLWKLPLHSQPTSVLCNVIDVNNDGCFDCLVIGKKGLMTAVDTRKGVNLWYIHSHTNVKVAENISAPTALPDCDNDFVPDLAITYAFPSEKNSVYLSLISGGTGEVIGSPIPLLHCAYPVVTHMSLDFRTETAFIFYCYSGKAGQIFLSYMKDICNVALNKTESMRMTVIYRTFPLSHDIPFQMVSTVNGKLAVVLNGTELILLTPARKGKFKVQWQQTFLDDLHWRFVASGSYLNREDSELVLLSSSNLVTKAVGLKINNGHQAWSGTFNNSIVTSVFSLPKFFVDTDGIVLKMLTPVSGCLINPMKDYGINDSKYYAANISDSSHVAGVINFTKTNTFGLTEESFVLVHVKDLPRAKKLSMLDVWCICKDESCHPDVFTLRKTAVATTLSNGEVDMCMLSTSMVPSDASATVRIQTSIKLLKIEKFSKFSKCMYELDS